MLPHQSVARVFEKLARVGRRTWQQGKRHVHQPQFESLIAHLEAEHLVPPLSESAHPPVADTVVTELGAGKGMFGRIISELTGAPTIAVERRTVHVNYDTPLDLLQQPKAEEESKTSPADSNPAEVELDDADEDLHETEQKHEEEPEAPETALSSTLRITADLRDCDLGQIIAQATEQSEALKAAKALVIAKHLCANATDLAVQCIQTASHAATQPTDCPAPAARREIASVVLAPCCHPQIKWEGYSHTGYLERLGFTPDDLPVMLQLLFASKQRHLAACECASKRWGALRALGSQKVWLLGRTVRRILEEGRAEVLRELGFHVKLVAYVPDTITPDNLLLIASRAPPTALPTTLPMAPSRGFIPDSGVFLHLTDTQHNKAGGFPSRVVDYILELRGAAALQGHSIVQTAWTAEIDVKHGEETQPETLVVVRGHPLQIAQLLSSDATLSRAVDQMIPYDSSSATLEELSAAVQAREGKVPVRVISCPGKTLAPRVVAALPESLLSPTEFTGVLSVLQWRDEEGVEQGDYLWSLLGRGDWDPRAWRATNEAAGIDVSHIPSKKRLAARSVGHHLTECATRPCVDLHVAGKRVLAVGDIPETPMAIRLWACEAGASEVIEAMPLPAGAVEGQREGWRENGERSHSGEWQIRRCNSAGKATGDGEDKEAAAKKQRVETEAVPCEVAVVNTVLDHADSVKVVLGLARDGWLAPGAMVVCKLQPNPGYGKKKAKEYAKRPRLRRLIQMNERASRALQGVFDVSIHHLVLDKEGERTACLLLKPGGQSK